MHNVNVIADQIFSKPEIYWKISSRFVNANKCKMHISNFLKVKIMVLDWINEEKVIYTRKLVPYWGAEDLLILQRPPVANVAPAVYSFYLAISPKKGSLKT